MSAPDPVTFPGDVSMLALKATWEMHARLHHAVSLVPQTFPASELADPSAFVVRGPLLRASKLNSAVMQTLGDDEVALQSFHVRAFRGLVQGELAAARKAG